MLENLTNKWEQGIQVWLLLLVWGLNFKMKF